MIYQIAIDGPVASGKGTVARMLARKFGLLCLDTGALYRGITIYFIDHGIDITDPVAYNRALGQIDLDVKCIEGETFVFLGGEDITKRLRDNQVSINVPNVAKLPEARAKVRAIQQQIGASSSLICEGRDIGSIIFPNARFKFYLTASVRERARRRLADLAAKGENVDINELERQITDRDYADMTRPNSPLICVSDAIKIDATRIDAYSVVKRIERIITKALMEN